MEIEFFCLSFTKVFEKEDSSKSGYVELRYFLLTSEVAIIFQGEDGSENMQYGEAYIKDVKDIDGIKNLLNGLNLRDNEEEVLLNIVHIFMGKVEEFKENK